MGASIGASLAYRNKWAAAALAGRAGGLTSVGGGGNHICNTEENCILLTQNAHTSCATIVYSTIRWPSS